MIYEFSTVVKNVKTDYSEMDAWPVFIDNFIEWMKEENMVWYEDENEIYKSKQKLKSLFDVLVILSYFWIVVGSLFFCSSFLEANVFEDVFNFLKNLHWD